MKTEKKSEYPRRLEPGEQAKHFGYEGHNFSKRDYRGEYITYQKSKIFGEYLIRIQNLDSGEVLDTFFTKTDIPAADLRSVVRGYAEALGAMSYV